MDSTVEDFDLIVVGGGPGGSTLATFVAMHGHKVLLLERERFPRYSIGESLLPGTVHGICRLLGVREEIERANFVLKYGGTWRWGREEALWSFFFSENEQLHRQKFDYAFQVERARFDEILLKNARRKGVDAREGHEVVEVLQEDGRTTGVMYVDAAGKTRTARASFVADASGHRSRMSRLAGERVTSKFFRNIALFGYFHDAKRRPPPRQGDILCAAFDVGWFWFIPLSDRLTSVGAVVDATRSDLVQGDRERALAGLIGRCPVVADLLSTASRVEKGMYAPLRVRGDYSYCNTRFHSPGLVLIGDSACFVDPVFSTGVHLATYSALLAARSIKACLTTDIDEGRAFQEFEHRYLLEFQNIYEFLLVIYDMNHDRKSYFWQARKILSSEEADNEAFVRLVAGFGTTGQDFFSRRAGLGAETEGRLHRHFYSPRPNGSPAPSASRSAGGNYADYVQEQFRRDAFTAERQSLTFGVPFKQAPVRAQGLVASPDGLSWVEPAFAGAG